MEVQEIPRDQGAESAAQEHEAGKEAHRSGARFVGQCGRPGLQREVQSRIEEGVDVPEFLALDREFHMATYVACRDDQLMSTVMRLWNSTHHYRRAFMEVSGTGRQWIVNAEHKLIIDALQRRDAEDAERYLVGHIRRTRTELARHPELFA